MPSYICYHCLSLIDALSVYADRGHNLTKTALAAIIVSDWTIWDPHRIAMMTALKEEFQATRIQWLGLKEELEAHKNSHLFERASVNAQTLSRGTSMSFVTG